MESITWADAEQFCLQLGLLSDERRAGRRYRLPTEAEWEYSCRANTRTTFWCGSKLHPLVANFVNDRIRSDSAIGSTLPVGQFQPNLWGLYDMHGNVAEWVQDWYSDTYYSESPVDDPQGPDTGSAKVTRGGSWQSLYSECRSAARSPQPPDRGNNKIGFRVVMVEAE
jgi:formylglycine-generating enzyme required for sulfatase activity